MKILITLHSLLYNRGSEAVLRSIVWICRFWKPDSEIIVSTGEEGEILKEIPDVDRMIPRYDAKGGIGHLLEAAKEADVVLVTGADNYDSPKGNGVMHSVNDQLFQVARGKTILYDCSLRDNNFIESTYEDIRRFSEITVRESLTEALFKDKFPEKEIKLYPDPAFVMPMQKCELPYGFEVGNMIGINVSKLILGGRYGADEEMILKSYRNMMDYILENTSYKIFMVQHILNNGFDQDAIAKLYECYKEEERVLFMKTELLNSMQVKYLISKLNFLITARTHASIAAYSTCVPTLVVSYSVKSVGIAKDLFGDYQDYVLPLKDMKDGTELCEKFKYILAHEKDIKAHLQSVIPAYKLRAMQFGEIL